DLLDDVDLLVTSRLEDDVELVLLLGRAGGVTCAAGGRRGSDGDGGGGGHAEGVLELLHELAELEEGHLLESVEQLVGAELRHGGGSFRVLVPTGVGTGWVSVCSGLARVASLGRGGLLGVGRGRLLGGALGR